MTFSKIREKSIGVFDKNDCEAEEINAVIGLICTIAVYHDIFQSKF